MATTEDELIKVRNEHGKALEGLGSKAFPNTFRETADMRAARKALVDLTKDDAKRALLPGEADTKPEDTRIPLYGRVVAKRGPFIVFRTPHGDVQALVVQDPVKMGYLGVMTVVQHLQGKPVEKRIDTGVSLVTKENMNQPDMAALLAPPIAKYLKE